MLRNQSLPLPSLRFDLVGALLDFLSSIRLGRAGLSSAPRPPAAGGTLSRLLSLFSLAFSFLGSSGSGMLRVIVGVESSGLGLVVFGGRGILQTLSLGLSLSGLGVDGSFGLISGVFGFILDMFLGARSMSTEGPSGYRAFPHLVARRRQLSFPLGLFSMLLGMLLVARGHGVVVICASASDGQSAKDEEPIATFGSLGRVGLGSLDRLLSWWRDTCVRS